MSVAALSTIQTPLPVSEVFAPFIELVVERALRREHGDVALTDAFLEGLRDQLWGETVHIWFRVLLEEFHEFREQAGLPCSADSAQALQRFASALRDPVYAIALAGRWPQAEELVHRRARMAWRTAASVATAWRADRHALLAAGLIPADFELDCVQFGAGDSHNEGQTVVMLSNTCGDRVVFKPRSAKPDLLLLQLMACLERASGIELAPCAPRTLPGSWGSWQEFVVARDLANEVEITEYYHRFGLLAGLFMAIGAGDLHHENILSRGPHPCVVDSETLLQPGVIELDGHVMNRVMHAGEHSPGATLMLPVRVRTGAFDVFVCALGVPWDQQSAKQTFELIHDGTDAVQMTRARVMIRHEANVVRCRGQLIDPLEYTTELSAGLLHAHRAIVADEDEFKAILNRARAARFRIVLRPTEVYAKFIDASVQSGVLDDVRHKDELLALLRDLDHNDQGRLTACERTDIAQLDVPAFYCRADCTQIQWREGVVSEPFFAQSPVDSAVSTLRLFCDRSAEYHRFTLETTLNELAAGQLRPYPEPMLESALVGPPVEVTEVIVTALAETAHHGTDDAGDPAAVWLSHLGHDGLETLEIDRAMSFHDFGGVAAFLAARHPCHPLTGPTVRALSLRSEPGPGDYSLSVFGGPLSMLMTTGGAPLAEADGLIESLGNRPEQSDVVSGLSGLLLAVCRTADPDLDWIARARRALVEAALVIQWQRPWFDLAHGELGLRWALFRSATVLGVDVEDAGKKVLAGLAQALNDSDLGPSWCGGAAGGLVVAADLHRAGQMIPPDLVTGLTDRATTLPAGVVDISVCHGVAGGVQALLRAADVGLLPNGHARAAQFWDLGMAQAQRVGLQTGVPGRTTILGYFLGWAGVADTAARLAYGPTRFDAVALLPFDGKELS